MVIYFIDNIKGNSLSSRLFVLYVRVNQELAQLPSVSLFNQIKHTTERKQPVTEVKNKTADLGLT